MDFSLCTCKIILFNIRSTMYNLKDCKIKLDLPKPCTNHRKRSFWLQWGGPME